MERDRRLVSAQELHANLRSAGAEISLATVYRHLQSLSEKGEIHAVHSHECEVLYRRCGEGTHHHLRCHGCGRTEELAAQVGQDAMLVAAADAGYDEVQFTIELAGRCAACRCRSRSGLGPSDA